MATGQWMINKNTELISFFTPSNRESDLLMVSHNWRKNCPIKVLLIKVSKNFHFSARTTWMTKFSLWHDMTK